MGKSACERGSVLLLVVLGLGLFIFGAIGLGIDGSRLYAERQMAQMAADSAAQAAMMSIFNHTNNRGQSTDFAAARGATWDCGLSDPRTPCAYAVRNRFGTTAIDTVRVYYPYPAEVPGIGTLSDDPVNLVQVTVMRSVDTTLIGMLGAGATTVRARAIAATLKEDAPIPILVTHPSLGEALKVQGNPLIRICGGPGQSIQVNSYAGVAPVGSPLNAYSPGGSSFIDLSRAGPNSNGTCLDAPTGADFGVAGGPRNPYAPPGGTVYDINFGNEGEYLQPNSPIEDPLKDVPYPLRPPDAPAPSPRLPAECEAACLLYGFTCPTLTCNLYHKGSYLTGVHVKNEVALFEPGIYYLDDGDNKDVAFGNEANGIIVPCPPAVCPAAYPWPALAGGTVDGRGILVYSRSPVSGRAQVFDVGANSKAIIQGTPEDSIYRGVAFFQDRRSLAPATSPPVEHRFGGGGGLAVVGTLYITNTRPIMEVTPAQYQPVLLQGNPGSETTIHGMIIVSTLKLGGTGQITMKLPRGTYTVRKVALVK